VTEPLDRSLLHTMRGLIVDASSAFESYDYARALDVTERFFWNFCDNYLELVKQRAYGAAGERGAGSARTTLGLALTALLRLFAPHLPFVTEEVWSWWQEGSVHRTPWPDAKEFGTVTEGAEADPAIYAVAADVLGEIRKAKTSQQKSLRAEVDLAVVRDTAERLHALEPALADVREAGRVRALELLEADEFAVEVDLTEDAA
jgi:valyl-tRNA synthetase